MQPSSYLTCLFQISELEFLDFFCTCEHLFKGLFF